MDRAITSSVMLLALAFFSIASPLQAFAQSDSGGLGLRGADTAILIRATPADPQPGDTVHFTVEGPLFDLSHSAITWTINDNVVAQGIGASSATYTLDMTGKTIDVSVQVNDPNWGNASNSITIVPLQLDLLFDSPSYVPPFYRGRALPTVGGTVRLQAIARFPATKGLLDESSITYTWSKNGKVLNSLSGKGRSSIAIDAPLDGDVDTISVRATANDETLSASANVTIPSSQPVVKLYEDHPLFGILFHSDLGQTIPSPQEMTVSAIPYFATIANLNDANLSYAWQHNDEAITASSTKRNEIIVSPADGPATIRLRLTHAVNFFLDVTSSWKFLFSPNGGGGSSSQRSQDMFHTTQ